VKARRLAARRLVELLRRRRQLRPLPAETLDYLSGGKVKPERLSVNEVRALLQMLQPPGTLLVLDGFERVLRAFGGLDAAYQGDQPEVRGQRSEVSERDCVSPLAELFLYNVAFQPQLRSKVLLTTRSARACSRPKAADRCKAAARKELQQMQPRRRGGVLPRPGHPRHAHRIEEACAPYGYHPLSLRLLAGLIVGDFQQPGDIAAAKR